MWAVDTNVLIRALVDDPSAPAQCAAAVAWFSAQERVYVPQIVQAELAWWMRRTSALSRGDCLTMLQALRDHPAIELEAADTFARALDHFRHGGDFADGVIADGAERRGLRVATFDRKFARRHAAATLLEVSN